jgi:transcriptional regulator with PAS, ATPase and Fis domain
MRQNMEELQATQEQMHRKNEEVENLLKQASENEESMKLQMDALQEMESEAGKLADSMKKEAESFKSMMMDILNEVPEKVFLKDAEGKMYLANQVVADAHGLPLSELIGKSDYDFVDKETADEWRKQELEILEKGEDKYVFEDKIGGKPEFLKPIKRLFILSQLTRRDYWAYNVTSPIW